jgi:hypothetical protein
LLHVCFRKVRSDARSDQLIALTRCLDETLPIEYRDLLSAALNQACTFQLFGGIRDGWPLNTQHFGEKALGDRQCVPVTAVTHHEQPTRQPLLEAVRTIARYRRRPPQLVDSLVMPASKNLHTNGLMHCCKNI